MTTIADFLRSLGLAEYAAGLYESGIDVSALPNLTEQDLEKLGIPPADRKRLLSAVAQAYSHPESFPELQGDAERRHLTILFCDLVGSTELSTRLDPEALNEIISRYRKCCARVFTETGGFVARYLGDGVLAYFGYPRASEDDAERAVNAGLSLVENVGQLHDDIGRPLQVRVGIASGLVLIGDLIGAGTEQRHDVVGVTPNLAARLQTCAEPNTVVISGETRQLVRDLFEYAPVARENLAKGALKVIVTTPDLPARRIEGSVKFLDNSVQDGTGTIRLRRFWAGRARRLLLLARRARGDHLRRVRAEKCLRAVSP